ncbi:MAG: class I tRNA ligase family protein, partial [Gammaproteobacteria bacterium]|nr:class I tRNA ligase family protein [Gammaproteobacteria bacterium]
HPVIPFISEEIWQRVAKVAGTAAPTIMLQPYPQADDYPADAEAEAELEWLKGFILGIRQIRGEMDIAPGKPLPVIIQDASDQDRGHMAEHELYLQNIARLESITILQAGDEPPTAATALLGAMKILVPLAGLIDVEAERTRLNKRRDKAEQDLQKVRGKLANEKFIARAPDDVVAKEKGRQQELELEISQLDAQLGKLTELD